MPALSLITTSITQIIREPQQLPTSDSVASDLESMTVPPPPKMLRRHMEVVVGV